ncbi:MAG: hypothetical protein ACI87W_001646 [Halieaceae bacterium]|jgi:hypothetical protein
MLSDQAIVGDQVDTQGIKELKNTRPLSILKDRQTTTAIVGEALK